ncbi:MAG TPA: amino acid adenylation domain-containing protein, partial [Candidatus Sericytochromatia bacterium]
HFETLLASIVNNSEQKVSELPILTAAEQQQLLVEWNNTKTNYPETQCLHQLFEIQAEKTPDALAVVFEDQKLTYKELNQRANQLAQYLQKQGVKPGVLVGICVERSLVMMIGILGILKAGGAYVPIDPAYPSDRVAFILADAQMPVLLTEQQILEKLPQSSAQVISLDTDWSIIAQENNQNPINNATADNTAYVIYTSGSTGIPKGVLVTHANVQRLFAATQSWYNFNQQDVWTLFHSFAFDFSVWEIWGALLYGGKLIIVPYLVSRSPELFYQLLCEQKVTVLNQTPSAFRQLIKAESLLEQGYTSLQLRFVIFGGEALELQSLQPWFERHGDSSPQLVNMYGITETTVHVTYRPITIEDLNSTASVIGRPIPDLQVYLLDQNRQPVPVGVAGEMYVGGAGVARGYLNRPELTNERFISHPFSNNPQAKLYKSGDLARYLPNGELEYLGRIDHQVKIRGFRIELAEIEAVLVKHPAVREGVVLVREDEPGDKRLVAYLVLHQGEVVTTEALRAFLKEKLPDYMVPAAFVCLEVLPLTINGKVDTRSLPAPDTNRPELATAFVVPRTSAEKILADIWSQILGVKQVGIYDNFFALGGDSIRSIQVQSLAQKQGLNFSLHQLFQYQTIYELVQQIQPTTADITTNSIAAFSLISESDRQKLPKNIEDAYPLARLQTGMLFHSQYSEESATYHDIFSFYLKAPFDAEILQDAIQKIVNHHPVLRTSFDLTSFSEPLQLVHQTANLALQVEDLQHLSASEQAEKFSTWLEAEKQRHFDWSQPGLLRFQIHLCSAETFQISVSFHHVILDGWSVAAMLTELFQDYLSMLKVETRYVESLQPELLSKFRDFVVLERDAIASPSYQNYWQTKLSDRHITKLPRWYSSQRSEIREIRSQQVAISSEICQGIKQLTKSASVPLKSVLLAAHLRVLSILSGQSDVISGLVVNGRPEQADGEKVLGMFLNTLPLRLQLSGGTWTELVQQVFAAESELLPYRRYPLAELQKHSGGQPLFEAAFNFVNFHVYQGLQDFPEVEVLDARVFEATDIPLFADFSVDPFSQQVKIILQYDAQEFCAEQIDAIALYYLRCLEAMAKEPQQRYEM